MNYIKVGDEITLRCKVTHITEELVRLEAVGFNSPIGYYVPKEVLMEQADSMVTVERAWNQEEEDNYRMRHQS